MSTRISQKPTTYQWTADVKALVTSAVEEACRNHHNVNQILLLKRILEKQPTFLPPGGSTERALIALRGRVFRMRKNFKSSLNPPKIIASSREERPPSSASTYSNATTLSERFLQDPVERIIDDDDALVDHFFKREGDDLTRALEESPDDFETLFPENALSMYSNTPPLTPQLNCDLEQVIGDDVGVCAFEKEKNHLGGELDFVTSAVLPPECSILEEEETQSLPEDSGLCSQPASCFYDDDLGATPSESPDILKDIFRDTKSPTIDNVGPSQIYDHFSYD